MVEGILFAAVSAALTFISRVSLRAPGSHGFYRYFAWEFLLVLFLLNMRKWFHEILSLHQLVAWTSLLISLLLAIQGIYMLWRIGKPDEKREDELIFHLEKTTVLVTRGIYRHIRHPIYSSLLFLGIGIFFKDPSWPGGILAAGATLFLVLTARAEEGENIRYFGAAYRVYMDRTRMFVPFVI